MTEEIKKMHKEGEGRGGNAKRKAAYLRHGLMHKIKGMLLIAYLASLRGRGRIAFYGTELLEEVIVPAGFSPG